MVDGEQIRAIRDHIAALPADGVNAPAPKRSPWLTVQEYEDYLRRLQEANISRSELFGQWFE